MSDGRDEPGHDDPGEPVRDPGIGPSETQGVLDCPVKPGNDNAEGYRLAGTSPAMTERKAKSLGTWGKPGVHELRISVSGLPGQAG